MRTPPPPQHLSTLLSLLKVMYLVVDNLLLDYVELPHILALDVHLVNVGFSIIV